MEPITATLAALSLLNGISGASNAAQTAEDNLGFQKDQAAKSNKLATATKTDAYGNQQVYDPATNTWSEVLTPTQKAIQQAGESQQYKTLTTDAERQRQQAQRQDQDSRDAGTPYNAAIQQYIHQQPTSAAADTNTLQNLIIQSDAASGKSNQATLERQALRLGRGADIPALIKGTDDQIGKSTPSAMLQALQGGIAQHNSDVQNHNQEFLPQIAAFKQIIDGGGGGASQRYSDLPGQVAASESASQNAQLSALNAANSGINTASGALVTAEGKQPDFSKLITALSAVGKNKKADATDPNATGTGTSTDYGDLGDYLKTLGYGNSADLVG